MRGDPVAFLGRWEPATTYYHTPMPEKLPRGTTAYVCECGKRWVFPKMAVPGQKAMQPCDCGRTLVMENGIIYGTPASHNRRT